MNQQQSQHRHHDVDRLGQVNAAKHDAGIGLGWPQREFHALAAVQPDADGVGQGFEGSLLQHGFILRLLVSVMPDLIRHPEPLEKTGFRLSPE